MRCLRAQLAITSIMSTTGTGTAPIAELPVRSVPPRPYAAVAFQGVGRVPACGDGDHVVNPAYLDGYVRAPVTAVAQLPVDALSVGPDGAVRLEGVGRVCTGRDGTDIGQATYGGRAERTGAVGRRAGKFAEGVVSPGPNSAIPPERITSAGPGGELLHIPQVRYLDGDIAITDRQMLAQLAGAIVAPSPYGPVPRDSESRKLTGHNLGYMA
jgi:hypothetical protein